MPTSAPTPSTSVAPLATPSAPPASAPGVERVDLRTANSQTFQQPDGSFVSQIYSGDLFYQPEGTTDWQPIDLRFAADPQGNPRSDKARVQLAMSTGDDPNGFAVLSGAGHTVRFRLPPGTAPGRAGACRARAAGRGVRQQQPSTPGAR